MASTKPAVPNGTTYTSDMQRKLYQRSREQPERTFDELFNLVHHPAVLQEAWSRLARRKGSRTAGIDGVTRDRIERRVGGVQLFLDELRQALKNETYQPAPVREHLIPKPGKPGKFRALGIPTLCDRVVQMALKLVLEPIFEADFYPCSFGFRPGRCTMDAIIQIAQYLWPTKVGTSPTKFVIEGDIKACFDSIDHHVLMTRIRKRIADKRVLRLIRKFLRAGVMSEGTLRNSALGTPQGGVISPLLANIYLQAIEEKYKRHVQGPYEDPKRSNNARAYDRGRKRPAFAIVRYADDFVILVAGERQQAEEEKRCLAEYLRTQLHVELSDEKTLVTEPKEGFNFLGYNVKMAPARESRKLVPKLTIPREAKARFRAKVRALTRRSTQSLELRDLLMQLNPRITGWRNYYRFAVGAYEDFAALDQFVWFRIYLWLRKKHPSMTSHEIRRRYEVRPRPTYKTWGHRGVVLRRLVEGGTLRYQYRGPKISNGWNEDWANGPLAKRREVGETNYAMLILDDMEAPPEES